MTDDVLLKGIQHLKKVMAITEPMWVILSKMCLYYMPYKERLSSLPTLPGFF